MKISSKSSKFKGSTTSVWALLMLGPAMALFAFHPACATEADAAQMTAGVAKASKDILANPGRDDVLAYRGECYKRLAKYDLSLADFSKAIQLNKTKDIYFHERATIYGLMRRYPEAINDMDAALRLAPKNAGYYSYRGLLLSSAGRQEEALKSVSSAIRMHPNENDYCIRATIYVALNRMLEARADMIEALKMDPKSAAALKLQMDIANKEKK